MYINDLMMQNRTGCVMSRIPEGSVLDPVLFVIYINDLNRRISSAVSEFADDTKIGRVITSGQDGLSRTS